VQLTSTDHTTCSNTLSSVHISTDQDYTLIDTLVPHSLCRFIDIIHIRTYRYISTSVQFIVIAWQRSRRDNTNYAAIYLQHSSYRSKMAGATAESSVGKKVNYYPLYEPPLYYSPESGVHRTTMNNFVTPISCTAAVLTLFLEMCLTNIISFIYQ
jgi:hypothetical protein